MAKGRMHGSGSATKIKGGVIIPIAQVEYPPAADNLTAGNDYLFGNVIRKNEEIRHCCSQGDKAVNPTIKGTLGVGVLVKG